MIDVLFVLNIIVVILLIVVILFQKSEGGVLGMGGAGTKNGVFSTRSAGNIITRVTYILGAMFFIICILLAILVSRREKGKSFISVMTEKNKTSGKEIQLPKVNTIPEDNVKRELIQESIKQEALNKKPLPPVIK